MKNLLFVLSSLAIVAALAVFTLWDSGDTAEPPTQATNPVSVSPEPATEAPAALQSPKLAPIEEETHREEVASEPEETETEEVRAPLASVDPEVANWVDVTVIQPPDAPSDANLVVLALNSALSYDEIYGKRGIVPERQRLEQDTSYRGLVAVAPVGADGLARIALPPDVEHPYLVVSGRYLYSTEASPIDLDSGQIELRPELGAWITGRLLPPAGLEGEWGQAEVRLATDIASMISLGTNSGKRLDMRQEYEIGSRFEFQAVPMSTSFTVGVESDALAYYYKEGNQAVAGEHLEMEVQLMAGTLVKGRVVNTEGQPVAGAEVNARTREFFGNLAFKLRETETDNDGHFELAAVAEGPAWILVEHDEYRDYKSPESIEVPADRELTYPDIVLDEGAHIAGSVMFPDGSPAEGAVLKIAVDLSANPSGYPMNPMDFSGAGNQDTADERGDFNFSGLSKGPYQLEATIEQDEDSAQTPGIWRGKIAGLSPIEQATSSSQLLLVLEAPQSITGIVLDTAGLPIKNFEVEASLKANVWYMRSTRIASEQYESEDGTFVLNNLQPGEWSVVAKAEGFANAETIDVQVPTEELLELALARPASLGGYVFDPNGNPVAGAVVQQELDLQQMILSQQGRLDSIPRATTDSAGWFNLESLPPGTGTVLASKDGWARSTELAYDLEEGQAIDDAELTLRVGGTITGILFDDEGEPKEDTDIFIQQPSGMRRRTTRTDAKGEFREEHLEPAKWQVMALNLSNQGGEFDQAEMLSSMKISMVDLEDGGEEHVILGALPENPVVVTGVLTSNGDPVTKSTISFIPAGGGGLEKMQIGSSDENGEYEVTLVESGDYLVTVQQFSGLGQQNSLEFRRRIPDGDSFELDFDLPVGRISGTVYGPDGDPLPNTRITLNKDGGAEFGTMFGGRYTESSTDESGEFVLENLRPDAYLVAAGGTLLGGAFGNGSTNGGRTVARVQVSEGQWVRHLDFHLEPPGTIDGLVVDHAGIPVEGAVLFARDENGNLLEIFSYLKSDAGGRFKYGDLAPGVYTIAARKDLLASSESERIRVRAGEKTESRVVMEPGTILKVVLQDKSGQLVPSVISVKDSAGREMNGMLGLEDLLVKTTSGIGSLEQDVGPLPPGVYSVRAVTDDGRSTKKTVTLTGQEKRKLRLRLK